MQGTAVSLPSRPALFPPVEYHRLSVTCLQVCECTPRRPRLARLSQVRSGVEWQRSACPKPRRDSWACVHTTGAFQRAVDRSWVPGFDTLRRWSDSAERMASSSCRADQTRAQLLVFVYRTYPASGATSAVEGAFQRTHDAAIFACLKIALKRELLALKAPALGPRIWRAVPCAYALAVEAVRDVCRAPSAEL